MPTANRSTTSTPLRGAPGRIVAANHALPPHALIEVVMDLGRPRARFPRASHLHDREVRSRHLSRVGQSAPSATTTGGTTHAAPDQRIRNRAQDVGLPPYRGRLRQLSRHRDFVRPKSILNIGRPGIGKTTMLREAARVLPTTGQGSWSSTRQRDPGTDIPHPAIGKARRMQVRTPALQHEVMIEAVENHMPQVIVIDEIGTELEAQAARTIAERGVQLIGTAHGNNLDNLMLNPTLSDLIGGIQSVTLGDEEARRRRTQKSVLERKAPPTFDVIVEIVDRERVTVHADVSETVDALLRGDPVAPELRWKDEAGVHRTQSRPRPSPRDQLGRDQFGRERFAGLIGSGGGGWRPEPGWRGSGDYRTTPWDLGSAVRPAFRPGASGGWRESRGRAGEAGRLLPGERIARLDDRRGPGGAAGAGGAPGAGSGGQGGGNGAGGGPPGSRAGALEAPFVAGELADRGPVERGAAAVVPDIRARDAREWERQSEWRDQAARALEAFKAEEGIGPANAADLVADDESLADPGRRRRSTRRGPPAVEAASCQPSGSNRTGSAASAWSRPSRSCSCRHRGPPGRRGRRRDAQRSEYRQMADDPRGGGRRCRSTSQGQHDCPDAASLTSIFALEVDPREAALRETEERSSSSSRVAAGSWHPRTPTSGASSTRWPSGRTSSRGRAAGSHTGGSASTRTRRAPGGRARGGAAGAPRRCRVAPQCSLDERTRGSGGRSPCYIRR